MIVTRLLNRLLSAAIRSCARSEIASGKTGEVIVALECFEEAAEMRVEFSGDRIFNTADRLFVLESRDSNREVNERGSLRGSEVQ